MTFAREGLVFILVAVILTLAAFALAITRSSLFYWILTVVLTVLTLWVAYFFRDPERAGDRSERVILAPADGRIVMITEVDEPAFIHGRALRLSIFMNVFNVHVNRYPATGIVKYVHYNKGKFLHAASEKSSVDNEQMSVGIESGTHRVLVRQIAGLIARRIVNYSREGDRVEQGERMGMIRFGSRVDLFVPTGSRLSVSVGDKTVAGATTVGTLPE